VEGLHPAATLVLIIPDAALGFTTFSLAIKAIEKNANDNVTICFTL
jgi:hypothetical protein